MAESSAGEVTRLIRAVQGGDPRAAADLLPLVYDELRRLARARLAKTPPGGTLQATDLVHEAYLRLVGNEDPGWNGRGHFFGAAATAMRNILVEQARRRASLKRGAGRRRVEEREDCAIIGPPDENLLALDEAVTRLEDEDPRKARVVLLHWFAGLSLEETAEALNVSLSTVKREWRFTRAWLYSQLADDQPAC